MTTPSRRAQTERLLALAVGGLAGSAARAGLVEAFPIPAAGWQVATLAANLSGALLLGLLVAVVQRAAAPPWVVHFLGIGLLGAYTTFSALSLEVWDLLDAGRAVTAVAYAAVSVGAGLAAAVAGMRLGARRPWR